MKKSPLYLCVLGLVSILVTGMPFTTLADGDLDVVDVVNHGATPPGLFGTSRLLRTDEGIAFELFTTGLVDGSPYSLWAFIDENSAELGGPPGLERFEIRIGADGRFADGAGEARFSGFLPAGSLPSANGTSVLATDDGSFDDPEEADILLIVRAHGPAVAGMGYEQTTNVSGGCPPNPANMPGGCISIQEALHGGDDDDGDSDSDSDSD